MLETLLHIDHAWFDFINQTLSNIFFDVLMPIIRNKKTWIPFYILGAIVFVKFKGRKGLFLILGTLLAVGLTDGISSHVLKSFFERARPCLLPEFANHVNLLVEKCSGGYSFPSSHAANHFAVATFLSIVLYKENKLWPPLLLLWASLISFAQVYVGVHFPSDVLAGAFLGSVVGMLIAGLYRFVIMRFTSST